MIYHNTVQKHSKTSADEYRQAVANKITTSNQSQSEQSMQEQSNMETMEFMVDYRKKEIKVTVEFPRNTVEQAEQEFISRLKEIYLKKIKVLSMQEKESALHWQAKEETGGKVDGN